MKKDELLQEMRQWSYTLQVAAAMGAGMDLTMVETASLGLMIDEAAKRIEREETE